MLNLQQQQTKTTALQFCEIFVFSYGFVNFKLHSSSQASNIFSLPGKVFAHPGCFKVRTMPSYSYYPHLLFVFRLILFVIYIDGIIPYSLTPWTIKIILTYSSSFNQFMWTTSLTATHQYLVFALPKFQWRDRVVLVNKICFHAWRRWISIKWRSQNFTLVCIEFSAPCSGCETPF